MCDIVLGLMQEEHLSYHLERIQIYKDSDDQFLQNPNMHTASKIKHCVELWNKVNSKAMTKSAARYD